MIGAVVRSLCLSVCLHACTSESSPDGAAGAAAGSGGAPAAGSGGAAAASCTPNLACTLSPPASTGDIRQDCLNRINQFRSECACLPPLERWTAAESCADEMATHDSTVGKAHAGFTGRICTPRGNGQNECPSYRSEASIIGGCLQQMWSEGPPPRTPCDGACFQSHGHFLNLTNPDFQRVACGFHRTPTGEVWGVQNFSP